MLVNTWSTLIGSRRIKIGRWGMTQGEIDHSRSPIVIIIMLLQNDGVYFRIWPILKYESRRIAASFHVNDVTNAIAPSHPRQFLTLRASRKR